MGRFTWLGSIVLCAAAQLAWGAEDADKQWKVHDESRPKPKVIAAEQGKPPADAMVLFDGTDLSKWQSARGGGEPKWKVENGDLVVEPKTGDIITKDPVGDCQVHIEWLVPVMADAKGQNRGNSGIKFMGRYEVQVLDSYNAETYADGQAASLYGQYPPLVNASRPPGQWQTFDIIFRGPRFDDAGKLLRPATATVLHNGVLVHDRQELMGTTGRARSGYQKHAEKLPLLLQEHGSPVRYRNIWLRPLTDDKP
jgi:hypothetical protein